MTSLRAWRPGSRVHGTISSEPRRPGGSPRVRPDRSRHGATALRPSGGVRHGAAGQAQSGRGPCIRRFIESPGQLGPDRHRGSFPRAGAREATVTTKVFREARRIATRQTWMRGLPRNPPMDAPLPLHYDPVELRSLTAILHEQLAGRDVSWERSVCFVKVRP